MLPQDFVARYGYPKYTQLLSVSPGTVVCERNAHRYSLVVYPSSGPVGIVPHENFTLITVTGNVTVDVPLDIAFSRHGSLVCDAWVVSAVGAGVNLLVIEGLADDTNSLLNHVAIRPREADGTQSGMHLYRREHNVPPEQPKTQGVSDFTRYGGDFLDGVRGNRRERARYRDTRRRYTTPYPPL